MKDKLLELVRSEFDGEELIKTECAVLLAYYGYIECIDDLNSPYALVPEDLDEAMKRFYSLPNCMVTSYKEEDGIIVKETKELDTQGLSKNFQIYYNVNVQYKFGLDLTCKQLNHYYRCTMDINDCIYNRNSLKRLIMDIPIQKFDYSIRMHDKNSIPAVVINKSASNNLNITLILCKKNLHSFWDKEQIVFTGKKNYTLHQLIEEISKRNKNHLRIDDVYDCFISATGSEGSFTLCEIDDESECIIFKRE